MPEREKAPSCPNGKSVSDEGIMKRLILRDSRMLVLLRNRC